MTNMTETMTQMTLKTHAAKPTAWQVELAGGRAHMATVVVARTMSGAERKAKRQITMGYWPKGVTVVKALPIQ